MAKVNVSRKFKTKLNAGLGKNGKESYKTISLDRLEENVSTENALKVGEFIGKIVDKKVKSVTKVNEEEITSEL